MNEIQHKIPIKYNERCFFVGTTGSGKTTLAKALLWDKPYVYVLDPKRTFTVPESWPMGSKTYTSLPQLMRHDSEETAIYRPSPMEMKTYCNDYFFHVFDVGNCFVFVDEVMSVCPAGRIGQGYAHCIQLGRERGIGTWSATQRPAMVPLVTMTESEYYFVFRLKNPDDRKRMGNYADPILERKVPDKNGFYYYNENTQRVKYYPKASVGVLAK